MKKSFFILLLTSSFTNHIFSAQSEASIPRINYFSDPEIKKQVLQNDNPDFLKEQTFSKEEVINNFQLNPFTKHEFPHGRMCFANFSKDSSLIVTASFNDCSFIFKPQDGSFVDDVLFHRLIGHPARVRSAELSNNNKLLLAALTNGKTVLYDRTEKKIRWIQGKERDDTDKKTEGFTLAHFSPNNERILFIDDNDAKVVKTETGEILHCEKHLGPIFNIEFSPDGNYFTICSEEVHRPLFCSQEILSPALKDRHIAQIINAHTYQKVNIINHSNDVVCARFSPGTKFIATASSDGFAHVFSLVDNKICFTINHQNPVNDVQFSPNDDAILATCSENKTTTIVDIKTEEKLHTIEHATVPCLLAFHQNGRYIAITNDGNCLEFFDRKNNKIIKKIEFRKLNDKEGKEYSPLIRSVQFSPNGRYLVTGSNDGIVRLISLFNSLQEKILDNLKVTADRVVLAAHYASQDKKE